MSKQASNRKPLIAGIIAAVAILTALLAVLLTQCAPWTGGSAGNIYLDGTAEFTMNGGSITGGSTKGSSGNIYLSGTMQMNGGTISGGRVLDAATGAVKENHSSANISAATGSRLELRGGTIRGGVAVRDGGVNDNKRTNLVLAGGPVVYSDTKGQPNLTIETGAEPVIVKVGNLTARAKIGITAQGIFSQKTSQINQENFISDISGTDVLYVDECLAVAKLACLCGQIKHVGDCDGKEILWSPWLSTNSLPASSGSFFLVNDVTYTKTKALGGTKDFINVDLDLNGKTITSAQRAINAFGTLNLADHAGGGKIIGVGIDNKVDHSGVALVYTDSKMNIYGGTLKLADKHNKITNGGVMGIGAGAVVNLYAGTIDGRTTETENTVEKGGAVRVTGTVDNGGSIRIGNGQLNIKDSQIYGHDVTGVGRSVCVKGGTVTLDGWVYVNNIYLKTGTNPIVVKDTLDIDKTLDNTASAVGIDMEAGTGLFAVAESGKELTYEMKSAFPYDRVALTEQGFELVGEDVPLGCLCGKTDGAHEAGCDKMDPKPWGETDSLPDSGNYYLTQNVELTAVKEIRSHLKLWLQGKNVTVKTGTTLDNLIKITNTGKLELLDSTQNPGTVDGLVTDAEDATKVGEITKNIIYMDGTLVLDGANLSGEGLATVENGLVICVNSGNFTMKSGSIVGGTVSNKFGGAIYANGTATIRIEGGTITGGTAKQGGNIFSRGTVEITGGSVTDGAYTDKGGNIYMTGGSLSITGVSGQATDIVFGGYKSTDATRTLTDRANIVCWDANISLTDVRLEGGVWVTGNKTCTLSGKVIVSGDGVGLTIGATTNGGNTAQVVIGNNFDTTSTVDLAIATWAAKAGKIYASGLTQAQADVFAVHTANVTKRQETGKDTWEIVYP